jgi:hypothetical protein
VNEDHNKKYIKGGMVVRLLHTEIGGYLTSDDTDFTGDDLAEVFIRKNKGDQADIEAKSTGGLFEIEIADQNERGRVCLWSENDKNLYRFRHLNTGRLVCT